MKPRTLTASAERRAILEQVSRWMREAARTRNAEAAIEGLLSEIDKQERRRTLAIAGAAKSIAYKGKPKPRRQGATA